MSPRRIQLWLLCGVACVALYFSLRLTAALASYFSLDREMPVQVTQWEIISLKDRYGLKASYHFTFQQKKWKGSFLFPPPYFLNEPAAFSALKVEAKKGGKVWFSSKNPSLSALEKAFPLTLLIRTSICCLILIYFFYLNKTAFCL